MMDVMTKNLGIEDTVLNALGSLHKPHHLSSKSHTVDVNDWSSLEVHQNLRNLLTNKYLKKPSQLFSAEKRH